MPGVAVWGRVVWRMCMSRPAWRTKRDPFSKATAGAPSWRVEGTGLGNSQGTSSGS